MLDIKQVLDRLKIDHSSRLRAIQDVRELIDNSVNPMSAAKAIITNLADVDFQTDDVIVARMTAQRLVDEALLLGSKYDPNKALKKAAEKIAEARIDRPWAFYRQQYSTVETKTETREGVAVEVKKDGSFKKGSKQVLAAALYEKHKDVSNKEIIAIFMKELDMSKPGATTYLYNCKKAK